MKIEKITLHKKTNPNVFAVISDDGREYVLHSDVIVKHGLHTGAEVSDDVMLECVNDSLVILATDQALKYVSSRLKTVKQLRTYLYGKGYDADTIDAVISKLREYSILDDAVYAKCYVNSVGTKSKAYIQNKLASAGVSKDIIHSQTSDIDDYSACERDALKYMRSKSPTIEVLQKLNAHLLYKGYTYDTVARVIGQNFKVD